MPEKMRSGCGESSKCPEKNSSNQFKDVQKRAQDAFNKGNFVECVNLLNSVLSSQKIRRDPLVVHNLAVAEFYSSGLTNIEGFKSRIKSIFGMSEVKIENAAKPLDSIFYCGYYNLAVVNYHIKQFGDVLVTLNQLSPHIKFIYRELAEKIVLLIIQTYLAIGKVDNAFYIVRFIGKLYQPKSSSMSLFNDPGLETVKDTSVFQIKLLEFECKCILRLGALCERELSVLGSNYEKTIEKAGYEPEECYQAHCENMKASLKIMSAHLYYLKKDFVRCVQTLNDAYIPSNYRLTGESIPMIVFNNMGCAHLWLKKPGLAAIYFKKSLDEYVKNLNQFPPYKLDSKNNNRPIFALGCSHIMMYNRGVALLYSGQPHVAFDCFTEVLQMYHMNPRLWFRLAECCIMAHKKGNEVDYDFKKKSELVQAVVGSSKHRKIVLNLRLFDNNKYSYDAQSFAIPVASLEFGTLCLRNTMMLLTRGDVDYSPCDIWDKKTANETLKIQTLVCSAYVALCVGDPLVCLSHTRCIFSLTNCPGIYMLLAHLYTAEAYMILNKIDEALKHLQPDYCNYISNRGESDPLWNPLKPYKPENATSVRSAILYNLAVVYIMKGQLGKANDILKEIMEIKSAPGCQVPVHVLSLTIYLELAAGRNETAISLLKQHCPQYFAKQSKSAD